MTFKTKQTTIVVIGALRVNLSSADVIVLIRDFLLKEWSTPFIPLVRRGSVCRTPNGRSQKLSPLHKMSGNLLSVCNTLNNGISSSLGWKEGQMSGWMCGWTETGLEDRWMGG